MTNLVNGIQPLKILLIDDDRSFLDTVAELLRRSGYSPITAEGGARGLEVLSSEAAQIGLVLLDMRMPGMDGEEVLERIVRYHPTIPVIMLTGENAIDLVVRAMKGGATNYIYKGSSPHELLTAVASVHERSRQQHQNTVGVQQFGEHGIVGRSSTVQRLMADAEMCARSMISVLVTGETGVGKDLLARAVHAMSPRRSKPFVVLDVPNIPATMFESELFGHTRGAFTGATDAKTGMVQAADGGTLFLDEIGEFPIELQSKFLRVLDSGSVRRLGSVTPESVDVRIISATNRNLLEAVRARVFREDLLYRLRGIEIHIPPLRERKEDIEPLAHHFLESFSQRNNLPQRRLSPSAVDLLERQRWSGNIRELRRAIEAVAVMSRGEVIDHSDIARVLERADPLRQPDVTVVQDYNDVQMLAKQTKKDELIKVLDRNDWNITRAAAELDIDRSTLSKQMKNLGINKPKLRL
ncbi:MAG TPA: sigma-54 dependent transcriptional regulator [Candidatus Kapabacteria bacterium]|nr:sigma-54 dependent transcriptional regulator [Candidatus Kapabacteria bacterium]